MLYYVETVNHLLIKLQYDTCYYVNLMMIELGEKCVIF
jgi:hypothetical protein